MTRTVPLVASAAAALAVLAGVPGLAQTTLPSERHELPALAKDLPSDFEEADAVFEARIRNRFPAGTSEQEMVETLASQGFSIAPDRKIATFEDSNIVCRLIWRVSWETGSDRKLTGVDAVYGGLCL